MTYLTKLFSLLALIFISLLPDLEAADLETTLKKNLAYKSFSDSLNNNQRPKLIFEDKVDDKPCDHCPKFLNLAQAVNKIVENVKDSDSITEANEQLIQVNKLKFLYYVVRSETDTGEINCKKRGEKENLRSPMLDGQLKPVTETMMDISSVTEVQYIPKGKEEVYYYYRGEGANSNVIIEVKMNKDGTSRMRYFDYQARDGSTRNLNLPDLPVYQGALAKDQSENDGNHLDVGIDIKTGKNLLPKDINFVSAKTKSNLAEDLNIVTDHQVGFNQQSTTISLKNDNGRAVASISGTNITTGKKSVVATLPMEVILDADSAMKLNGKVVNEYSIGEAEGKSVMESKRALTLALTDKNHEYITVKADSTSSGVQAIEVSSKHKVGKSSSLGAGYKQSNNGTRSFNINNVAKFDNYGTLTTSFGGNSNGTKFVETQLEKKISENSSMIVSVKSDSEKETVFMYQLKTVF
ncbi:MAG: hypothetical protein PHY93_12335 [Bacteriovorax sp.]|nr:hypothetical protein [Bacteriovorax sp.]